MSRLPPPEIPPDAAKLLSGVRDRMARAHQPAGHGAPAADPARHSRPVAAVMNPAKMSAGLKQMVVYVASVRRGLPSAPRSMSPRFASISETEALQRSWL